jgi:hypothetical protein
MICESFLAMEAINTSGAITGATLLFSCVPLDPATWGIY